MRSPAPALDGLSRPVLSQWGILWDIFSATRHLSSFWPKKKKLFFGNNSTQILWLSVLIFDLDNLVDRQAGLPNISC